MLMIDGHNSTASTLIHAACVQAWAAGSWQICEQRSAKAENMLIFAHLDLLNL